MPNLQEMLRCWFPSEMWTESDGLTVVPDFHYYLAGRNHDHRYRTWGALPGLTIPQTRKLADLAFKYEMRNLNYKYYPSWLNALVWNRIAHIYYLGVRVFGWDCYKAVPSDPALQSKDRPK